MSPEKRGSDVVIEAVGRPDAWEWAIDMVRKGGTVNFFGGCASGTKVQLDTNRLHYSEVTLKATFHHTPETVRRAFALIAEKKIRSTDYITGEAPLSRLAAGFPSHAESQWRYQDCHHSRATEKSFAHESWTTAPKLTLCHPLPATPGQRPFCLQLSGGTPSEGVRNSCVRAFAGRSARILPSSGAVALRELFGGHLVSSRSACGSTSSMFMPIAASRMISAMKSAIPHASLRLLDQWEAELDACYAGSPRHPVFVALARRCVSSIFPSSLLSIC